MSIGLLEQVQNKIKGTPLDLISFFVATYGVDVYMEDDLYGFKYNAIVANWKHQVTTESRGAIIRIKDGHASYVSRPFDKFFNQSESQCEYKTEHCLQYLIENGAYLSQKCDGTCIQMWYDEVKKCWRVSTLGTITPLNAHDSPITFSELFFSTIKSESNFEKFDKNCTYIFELCTQYNQIVTRYPSDRVYILGARNKITGEYVSNSDLKILLSDTNVMYPQKIPLMSIPNLNTWEDLYKIVEEFSDPSHGINPEGWVCCLEDGQPVFKMKRTAYVALHKNMTGDFRFVKKLLVRKVILGEIDDIYGELFDHQVEFVDRLKKYLSDMRIALETAKKLVNLCGATDKRKRYEASVLATSLDERIGVYSEFILKETYVDMDFFEYLRLPVSKKGVDPSRLFLDKYMDTFKEV